jgi:exocyst complex component 2
VLERGRRGAAAAAAGVGAASTAGVGGEEGQGACRMSPRGVSVTDEDFDPALFLSSRHNEASYTALKQGLGNLSTSINDHKRLLKSLVLQHFDQFLRCKDCIDGLQEGLQEQGSSHVDHVKDLYEDLEEAGEKLYKPLLDAKRDTEKTRSGLNVLRRFRFLFEIPATIQSNVEVKEYDKVVKEYRRAKLLVSRSQRPVYQRVWQEVESIVSAFRHQLMDTLSAEAQLPWEQHVPIVKCLVALDCPVNPVAQLLRARQGHLQNMLDEAHNDLKTRVSRAPSFICIWVVPHPSQLTRRWHCIRTRLTLPSSAN